MRPVGTKRRQLERGGASAEDEDCHALRRNAGGRNKIPKAKNKREGRSSTIRWSATSVVGWRKEVLTGIGRGNWQKTRRWSH